MMKLSKMMAMVAMIAAVSFTSCRSKMKDADVQKSLQAKEATGVIVEVKDGVATLTGIATDETAKTKAAEIATAEKGVSKVVNDLTVPMPVVAIPESVNTQLDAAKQQIVKDGLKDIKGVTVEFAEGKAILAGAVSKLDRIKIMQMLQGANVRSDVSKLMDK